jgi:hypothetical protein
VATGGVYTPNGNFTKTGGVIAGVAADSYDDNEAFGAATRKGNAVYYLNRNKKVDGDVTGNLTTEDSNTGWD